MPVRKCVAAALAFSLFPSPALPKDLELMQKAGEYEVVIRIDKNPPVLGNNRIEIAIMDNAGEPVTSAKVLVNYYMPPMPRMVPMNYRIEAKLKGRVYRAPMKIIMSGPWIIAVKITRGGSTATAKFHVDAR